MSLPQVALGEFMLNRNSSTDPARFPDELFMLYSIPAFDAGRPERQYGRDIGSAKKNIEPGDILLSRLVPHIRRSWIVGHHDQTRIIGSGEWIIFRSLKINAAYLRHFLVSDLFHCQFMRTVAGVGGSLLRANPHQVAEITIPSPPLDEQRRIAAILDKADALRRGRKRTLDLLDGLTQSIFLEMFGDLTKHKTIRFDETLSRPLRNGISPSKAGKVAAKVLTLSAVTGGSFKPQASKEATFDVSPAQDLRVQKEDFLICRGNGNKNMVGMGVICPVSMPDTAFPDTIIAAEIDFDKVQPHYLEYIWKSAFVRRQIELSARTTNGTFKVNQTMLEGIKLPNPPLSLQREYGARVAVIKDTADAHGAQLSALDLLFSSLQHRAFTGQL